MKNLSVCVAGDIVLERENKRACICMYVFAIWTYHWGFVPPLHLHNYIFFFFYFILIETETKS